MTAWLVRSLARAVLDVAVAALLFGLALVLLALFLGSAPYRRARGGPSVIGARIAATQELLLAIGALVATRTPRT